MDLVFVKLLILLGSWLLLNCSGTATQYNYKPRLYSHLTVHFLRSVSNWLLLLSFQDVKLWSKARFALSYSILVFQCDAKRTGRMGMNTGSFPSRLHGLNPTCPSRTCMSHACNLSYKAFVERTRIVRIIINFCICCRIFATSDNRPLSPSPPGGKLDGD